MTSAEDAGVNRIIPQNLTAQAAYNVAGNPPSHGRKAVWPNCFPGLEYDHRTLDTRFFPALVFAYVASGPNLGAMLTAIDRSDRAQLSAPSDFLDELAALETAREDLGDRPWFLTAVQQGGRTIEMVDSDGDPLDGMTVWRLIRSLRPESVTITLAVRSGDTDTTQPDPPSLNLTAARRRYTDDRTGVIDNAYQPGELTAGLCSPWTHDFRDCSCTYWASNHPDIVLPALPRTADLQPSGLPTDPAYQTQINWLRDPAFPDMQAPALPSQGANRPLEANYYQINKAWQDLAVVLEGRETDGIYVPRGHRRDHAEPFADSAELMARIAELAGLEHLVAVMYLYALFSVIDNDQAEAVQDGGTWPTITEDIAFTRAVITEVAIGEMQHMRSANRLLWELAKHTGTQHTARVQPPALRLPTAVVPMTAGATAAELLAPLTLTTVGKFIEIERSSAYIDGQYARVTATLKQPGYPPSLFELASTIANEGEEHFLDFCDIRRALTQYGSENPVYLRPMTAGDPATNPDVQAALDTYRAMLADLETGYTAPKASDQAMALGQARAKMFELSEQAEALAASDTGIPFLSLWQQ